MLKPKELRFKSIGRFVDEQIINFDELGCLVQVDGHNMNTNGSSGSGKTTIFNALDYLFGLNDLPINVLQSRLTKESIIVSGVLDWDGISVTITRSKKGLSIKLPTEKISGSNKIAEERLQQIIGMPKDLFRKILHKRQKEGGFFLQFTPSDIHSFLIDCLNLHDLNKKVEKLDKIISELEEKDKLAQFRLNSSTIAIQGAQDALLDLGLAPIRDMHPEVVLDLKTKCDASVAIFREHEAALELELKAVELEKPILRLEKQDTSMLEAYETGLLEVRKKIQSLQLAEKDRLARLNKDIGDLKLEKSGLERKVSDGELAGTNAIKLAAEIKHIRANTCPTCEQVWSNDRSKTKEATLLTDLQKAKENMAAGKAAQEKIEEISAKIKNFTLQLVPVEILEINELKVAESKFLKDIEYEKFALKQQNDLQVSVYNQKLLISNQKIADLREKHKLQIEQARGQADVDRRALEVAANKLKNYEENKARYETTYLTLKAREEKYLIELETVKTECETLKNELELAKEAKKIINSYISCNFDEALEYIGSEATRIIRNIPNMANATLQLEGTKETQAGKIKEEVNVVVSMDGELGVPLKSLSGGERSSIDLAVDLAVIDLIENKTGKGIDIFVLDEPFTGLDTISIEMALEVLKSANTNKKLFIVDHNPEVKQMVNNRIVVTRTGATSTVNQAA